jgi:hypothetical protein
MIPAIAFCQAISDSGFAARETYVRVVNDALRRYRIDRPIRVTSWPPRGSGRGGGDALGRRRCCRRLRSAEFGIRLPLRGIIVDESGCGTSGFVGLSVDPSGIQAFQILFRGQDGGVAQ